MTQKYLLSLLISLVLAAVLTANAIAATNSYVVSLAWEASFCKAHPSAKECTTFTPERYDASKLSLHGLWPDNVQYCGVDPRLVKLDKKTKWQQLPEVKLSDFLRARLDRDMAGTMGFLERHEWIKHGTCTAGTQESYFQKGVDLADGFNATPLAQLVTQSLGQSITLEQLKAQAKTSFGAGSDASILFICQSAKMYAKRSRDTQKGAKLAKQANDGNQLLEEIRVYLTADSLSDLTITSAQFSPPKLPVRNICLDGAVAIPGSIHKAH